MNDRELLELAAKAYGVKLEVWQKDGNGVEVAYYLNERGGHSPFQPLHENQFSDCMGDALRLAVKLRLHIDHSAGDVIVWICDVAGATPFTEEDAAPEATRSAIVRAAAALGKEMP